MNKNSYKIETNLTGVVTKVEGIQHLVFHENATEGIKLACQ